MILKKTNGKTDVDDDVTSYEYEPVIKFSLGQYKPYNKYVEKYHPECPIGCGPVAGAMIMACCKQSLNLNDTVYAFSRIIKALEEGESYDPTDTIHIVGTNGYIENPPTLPPITWTDSYAGAVDAISYLLYRLGCPDMMGCIYNSGNPTSNTTPNALRHLKMLDTLWEILECTIKKIWSIR